MPESLMNVRMPDGTIITNVPAGTTQRQLLRRLRGVNGGPPQGYVLDNPPPEGFVLDDAPSDQLSNTERMALTVGGGFNEGLASVMGLPVDLVTAALNAMPGVNIKNPVGGSEHLKRLAAKLGEAPEPRNITERVVGRVAQEVGASALPVAASLRAAKGVTDASRALPIIRQAVTSPGKYAAAETGTAVASGLGAATAKEVGAPEIVGQVAGSLTPAAASGSLRRIVRGGAQQAMADTVDDFARAGASPSVGQATGRRFFRGLENLLTKQPGSAGRIAKVATRTQAAIGQRVERLTQSLSARTTPEDAGRAIEIGLVGRGGFVERFRATANGLYGKLGEKVPSIRRVGISNTRKALDDLAAPIPGAPQISQALDNPKIAELRNALASDAQDGFLTFEALQATRSKVGNMLGSFEIVSDVPRAQLKRLYGALSDDIRRAARDAGASKEFMRANNYYKAGIQRIDDQLRIVTSKLERQGTTFEQIFKGAVSGSADGGSTLRALRKSLQPKEWNVVSAAVLKRMGRAVNSKQDELGEVFSSETFLTNWNKLAPDAKDALFADKGLRGNLDTIAKVASNIRESGQAFVNPSGTASAAAGIAELGAATGALVTGNLEVPAALLGLVAVSNRASALLTSPKFVNWLAQSTQIPAERLPGHIARLSQTIDADNSEAVNDYLGDLMAELQEQGDQ